MTPADRRYWVVGCSTLALGPVGGVGLYLLMVASGYEPIQAVAVAYLLGSLWVLVLAWRALPED